ncbi:MAG: two-component sensor histidine kinase [Polyangiaceae bacterium]|nr:two-component sensor histidine kinase [Polyangiaceae bacterium]
MRGQTGGYSSLVAFATVAVAYALSAVYAAFLRSGQFLREVAYAQLVTDQLSWTAIVFVTGGVTSGATSLYGLTCIAGAVALGRRGAFTGLGAALVCYVGITAALIEGLVPLPPDQRSDLYVMTWSEAAYPMLANSLGLTLVASMAGYLAHRLRVAGGDLALAEARAQEAERLALLGRLAAGLAHEIRNPLGGIAGSIELLRSSEGLTEEDRRLCEIVQREAARLNDLVGDMLDLSKPRDPQPEDVDIAQLARDVVALASRSGRGEDVRVRYDGLQTARVMADASQIRQVVWNLVRNAVQSSSAGDEVLVGVTALPTGELAIAVADRGPGIPAEARKRIFDAFFTTRSHGTGVGLAVVKRIVDAHGFRIEVAGRQGATFRVLVPQTSVVKSRAEPVLG